MAHLTHRKGVARIGGDPAKAKKNATALDSSGSIGGLSDLPAVTPPHPYGRVQQQPPPRRFAAKAIVSCLLLASPSLPAATIPGVPFAAKQNQGAPTLFIPRPPLPVDNPYEDPRMWGELYQEFSIGAVGTGVAMGDFNGDGLADVYVVSKDGKSRLFRNEGSWKFTDVTSAAGLADDPRVWKQGAAFADVDNDGRLDLYVCRFNAPNLLYRNLGDGTFREEGAARGLALVDASGMASFCDYDRDGDLDVLVQTNLLSYGKRPGGQPDYLLQNDGSGRFTDVTAKAGITGDAQGHSATWWDYNGDGWPDLYLANDFEAPDRLWHNRGDGTFVLVSRQALPHTPFSAMGADTGDLNNDGFADLLVADMAARARDQDQRSMALSRARTREEESDSAAPYVLHNCLYLGTGTPQVREAAMLTGLDATDWTWSVRFEDLDNDGRLDVHITNGMVRELHNGDLLSRIMTAESSAERIRIMRASPVLAESNLAFRNLGDLAFEEVGKRWGLDQLGVSFGAAFGDLDNDGDLDLVFTNYQGKPTLLENTSRDANSASFALVGTKSNRFGIGARVTVHAAGQQQMRTLVSARGYLSTSEPIAHFGLGGATAIDEVRVEWPSGLRERFPRLAANSRYTLTEGTGTPDSAPSEAPAWLKETTATSGLRLHAREDKVDETVQQPLLTRRHHRRGPSLLAADLNGDGRDDLVHSATTRDPAQIWLRQEDGTLKIGASLAPGAVRMNGGPLAALDIDADGDLDLLETRGGANFPAGARAYQPRLWLNDGHANFSPAPETSVPSQSLNTGAVAVADFNQDGREDVFIGGRVAVGRYPKPPASALWHGSGSGLVDATATVPGLADCGMVTAARAVDLNGDGWVDLLVAVEWGHVEAWLNERGTWTKRTRDLGLDGAGTGWWCSLDVADLNGDGRPDIVVGNAGLNTPYRVPAVLYAGDFKGGTTGAPPALIEALVDGGREFPLRSRKQLASAVPTVLRTFQKIDDYSRATLEQLIPKEKLAAAMRLEATQLASGVLLSNGSRFTFTPLPRVAQMAPLTCLWLGDLNQDGKVDLVAGQNSPLPHPVIGRFSGGLGVVLAGNGDGTFREVAPHDSGLLLPGFATDLVKLTGASIPPLFVVARNDEPALVFTVAK
ncbi:MAG: VCBS repeat-containing protein [Opitutaceae bacterium]|nr:VCBS repeat-containing protein [Opitutaceae bacterium]